MRQNHSARVSPLVLMIVAVLVGVGVFAAYRLWHGSQESLARMAPADTVGFLEINDLKMFADAIVSTAAWKELSPLLNKSDAARELRLFPLLGLSGKDFGDFFPVRTGLIITGAELHGSDVMPEACFLFQFRYPTPGLLSQIQKRLQPLANQAYGECVEEATEYEGYAISTLQSPDGSRRIVSSVAGDIALIGNSSDTVRAIIDTHRKKAPSLFENDEFRRHGLTEHPGVPLYGFLNTKPLSNAARSFPWPGTSPVEGSRLARNIAQILFTGFNISLVYKWEVVSGMVVERLVLPSSPWLEQLGQAVAAESEPAKRSLEFIPPDATGFTLLRVGDLTRVVEMIDWELSQRLSAIPSLALRELLIRTMISWGLDKEDTLTDAVRGDVLVVEDVDSELLTVMRVSNKSKLAALMGKYLRRGGATVRIGQEGSVEVYSSSAPGRNAFCFVSDRILIGSMSSIRWALDAQRSVHRIDPDSLSSPVLADPPQGTIEMTVRLDREGEVRQAIELIQGLTGASLDAQRMSSVLNSLPPKIRTTKVSAEGLVMETRSAFGEVPFWLVSWE